MTQTKGFKVFARTSSSKFVYKTYNPVHRLPSPPASEYELSPPASPPNELDVDMVSSAQSLSFSTVSSVSIPPSQDKMSSRRQSSTLNFWKLESAFAQEVSSDSCENQGAAGLWYILATAVLLAFHKEHLVADLWKYLSHQHDTVFSTSNPNTTSEPESDKLDSMLTIARRIRESCLKASVLVGFPRAINALQTLHETIKSTHPNLIPILETDPSLRSTVPPAQKSERGYTLFSKIYAHHTPRVLHAMNTCSAGDLTHFAMNSIYGELLAESAIISDQHTGVLEFVCCLADGVAPQAKGHWFGSRNLGAGPQVLRAAVAVVEGVAVGVGRGGNCVWREGGEEWVWLVKGLGVS